VLPYGVGMEDSMTILGASRPKSGRAGTSPTAM
jgi:hypothetical protein